MFVIDFASPAIVIFFTALVIAIITKALKEKFIDKDKMKRNKERMKKKQEQIKKLTKDGENEKANELQMEILKDSMESMGDMKTIFVIGIPYIIVSGLFRYVIYPTISFESLFALPKFAMTWIIPLPTLELTIITGALKAFTFYYLFWVIIIGLIWMIFEKLKKRSEMNGKTE